MTSSIRLYHLPGLYMIIFLALELAVYFFYLYYRNRAENFGLNKVLLAYGFLSGLGNTSFILRMISNYYIEDPTLDSIIMFWTQITISVSFILNLLLLSSKDFNEIINTNITRGAIIATIILNIIIFITELMELRFILITILFTIGLIYVVAFQLTLINATTGGIKRRLKITTLGAGMTLFAVMISSKDITMMFSQSITDLIFIISIPMIMAGVLIVLFSMYDFPIFLEFDWRKELVNLYILEKKEHNQLFKYDFTTHQQTFNPEFIPGGLLGIETIISAITDTPEKKINRIEQKNRIFLMIRSDSIIYTLIVNKEMRSIHFFLESIKERFENLYKSIIKDLSLIRGREEIYFVSFDAELKNILKG